jgi:hypothetical protein
MRLAVGEQKGSLAIDATIGNPDERVHQLRALARQFDGRDESASR